MSIVGIVQYSWRLDILYLTGLRHPDICPSGGKRFQQRKNRIIQKIIVYLYFVWVMNGLHFLQVCLVK